MNTKRLALCAALAVALWCNAGRPVNADPIISVDFGRRVAEIALGVFTVLVFWNFEAWIINKNIDRAVITGKFDALYTRQLSSDAIPTLVERRTEIPSAQRDSVTSRLGCQRLAGDRRWFEWNRSVAAADRALRSAEWPPCEKPKVKRFSVCVTFKLLSTWRAALSRSTADDASVVAWK